MSVGNAKRGFAEGVQTPFSGLRYLARHRQLWPHVIPPAIFNFFITIVALAIVIGAGWYWWSQSLPWFVAGQAGARLWLWTAAAYAFGLLLVVAAFFFAILVWRLSSAIVCGTLYGRLAEATERSLGIDDQELGEIKMRAEIADAMLDLGAWLRQQLVSVAVAFLPFIGPLAAAIISSYATSFQLGMDYMQYPLTIRGWRREQRLEFGRTHRGPTLGVGAGVFFIEWIPIVSSILLPATIVGAVLLHRKLTAVSIGTEHVPVDV